MAVAIQPAQPGLGAEGDEDVALQLARSGVALARQGQDGFALRRVVTERGQHGGLGQQGGSTPGPDQLVRHPVAEGDGAGLVQQQGAHVAGGLHRPARLGDHVELHQPVHAGDADGGEQTADGGRDQGDEQRQQIESGHLGAVVVEEPGQGGHHQQEDQGQPHQQGIQRHLVGVFCRLAPSTSAIMRSSVLSPGLLLMCTQIWSETTVVLPVTPLRSVPDSRMTGADSPVMAASLTEAMPATTSPS